VVETWLDTSGRYAAWPARLLPVVVFDTLMGWLGITRSMDHFRGRQDD
jgi:hypothetical protein